MFVGVLRALRRHRPAEDDVRGLFEGELCALDVVGEVRLEEPEDRHVVASAFGDLGESGCEQVYGQLSEALDADRVVANAARGCSGPRGGELHVVRAEQGADEPVEHTELLVEPKLRRNGAGLVAEPVQARGLIAAVALQGVFELAAAERARGAPAPRARRLRRGAP